MATRNFKKSPSDSHEPKTVGAILSEMLRSDSHFAAAYPKRFYPNTELAVDLKLLTHQPGRMPEGAYFNGVLRRDGEQHFTFIQTLPLTADKRNPHVYKGQYVTITRKDDGSYRPNLKQMPELGDNVSIDNYAFEVYRELRQGLEGLIEE